jgi:hypothetical protein
MDAVVSGSRAQPDTVTESAVAVTESMTPIGAAFVTVTVRQPSDALAPGVALMPYTHRVCLPGVAGSVVVYPCRSPFPNALSTSGREASAVSATPVEPR